MRIYSLMRQRKRRPFHRRENSIASPWNGRDKEPLPPPCVLAAPAERKAYAAAHMPVTCPEMARDRARCFCAEPKSAQTPGFEDSEEGGPCNQIKKHGNGDTPIWSIGWRTVVRVGCTSFPEKHVVKADQWINLPE